MPERDYMREAAERELPDYRIGDQMRDRLARLYPAIRAHHGSLGITDTVDNLIGRGIAHMKYEHNEGGAHGQGVVLDGCPCATSDGTAQRQGSKQWLSRRYHLLPLTRLGGRLGVTEHTIYSDYLEEQGVTYVPLAGAVDAAEAVLAGEVDAVLVDHGYAVAKLAEHEGRLEAVGPRLRLDRGLGMGVRAGSDLLSAFNEALDAMRSDGTLNALIRRWLGDEAATFE